MLCARCCVLLAALLGSDLASAGSCVVNVDMPYSNVSHVAQPIAVAQKPMVVSFEQSLSYGSASPQTGQDSASRPVHYKPPPLLEAVTAGDSATVHKLLASNPIAGNRNLSCEAVNRAILGGHFEILKDLVGHGADLLSADSATCRGRLLDTAAYSLDSINGGLRDGGRDTARIVHLLLEAGADTRRIDAQTQPPLILFLSVPSFPAQAEIAADFLAHGAQDKESPSRSALAFAASRYDVDSVRAMLRYPDAVRGSLTEAYLAAIYGDEGFNIYPEPAIRSAHHAGTVGALLDAGADVNARRSDLSYKTETPIVYALSYIGSREKNFDVADVILAHDPDLRATGRFGVTPLMLVAQDPKRLQLMLSRGANVNAQDEKGLATLHRALEKSDQLPERLASIALLLSHGADPNLQNKEHVRALNLVLAEDHEIIDLLVAHGARPSLTILPGGGYDIATQGKWVYGPLTWALLNETPYVAESLLRHDQRIDANDCGIAYYAAEVGQTALLKQAIALKARLDLKRANRWYTPLIASAENGHTDTVAVLLNIPGVDINESVYPPPLVRAREISDGLVMIAIQMGGPMTRGQTALMLSAERGHTDTVKLLLAHGARRDITDTAGRTAFDYANGTDIIELLKPH